MEPLGLLLACRDMERLRQFGELVNIAKKAGFAGHNEVKALLEQMAAALGADINKQPWYTTVSCAVVVLVGAAVSGRPLRMHRSPVSHRPYRRCHHGLSSPANIMVTMAL